MKRFAIAAAMLFAVAISSPAFAQDWTGIYLGINAGGAFGHTDWTYQPSGSTANHDSVGPLGGLTVGGNWQFGQFVLGAEADIDKAQIDGQTSCPNPIYSCESSIGAFGSVRGRAGFAWGRFLIYGTGGMAAGDVNIQTRSLAGSAVPPSLTPENGSTNWEIGWIGGVGGEFRFSRNFSAKLEWSYYDLGSQNRTVDFSLPVRASEQGQIIRLGLNYHFGAPPPPPPPMAAAAPVPAAAPAPPPPPPMRTFLVFFDFDKSTLTADGRKVIEAAAGAYKKTGTARIDVLGYTDLAGTQAYNLRLSRRRANTVAAYLAHLGVPRNIMAVKWFGKEHPRVPTPNGVREPQNRRVEIMMH